MLDPFVTVVGIGLLGSVAAGPLLAHALQALPEPRRRSAEWMLVVGAGLCAIAVGVFDAPLQGWAVALMAALPGFVAYLAWRSLVASTFVALLPGYFIIGQLTRQWPTHVPAIALDGLFTVQPGWMLVYGSLYVFVVVLPLLVVRDASLFRRMLQAYLTVMVVSYAGFLLYPTSAPRPEHVLGTGFAAWSLRLAYSLDPPHGCFPSLHVAYSFVSAGACLRVHRAVGVVAGGWAALIGVSTLYTKQHYAVDVFAGALAAGVAYALFLHRHPQGALDASDRRRAPVRALTAVAVFALTVGGFWVVYSFGLVVPD